VRDYGAWLLLLAVGLLLIAIGIEGSAGKMLAVALVPDALTSSGN
jgi:hypothetical protein